MAFCRNCGSEVPKGTKFCSNCGTSVEIQAEALNPNDEQMKDIVANAVQACVWYCHCIAAEPVVDCHRSEDQ